LIDPFFNLLIKRFNIISFIFSQAGTKVKSEPTLSSVKQQRQSKILDAALILFTRQGYRGTTIEGIADAVGMSKVTIYGYFADKDEIFRAVGSMIADRLSGVVNAELAGQGPLKERVHKALSAKQRMVFEIVRGSAFATELFQMNALLMRDIFESADAAMIANLAKAISAATGTNASSNQTAALLFHASLGIANGSADTEAADRDIKMLVYAVLASESEST
jgi:AcrR family transcriptional regulator